MIDILGDGPYLSLEELLLWSLKEWGAYYLHFFFFLAVILLLKRFASHRAITAAAMALPFFQIIYVYSVSIKSEFLYSFFLAFLITTQVRILKLLPLKTLDYIFLFSAMLFPNRLFNTTSAFMGNLWYFWLLFCVIYTTAKVGVHKLEGNHFVCYFLFVVLSLSMYSYSLAFNFLYPAFNNLTGNSAFGIIGTICVMTGSLLLFTFFIKTKFYRQLMKLNALGIKYKNIEHYFFCLSIVILLFFTLIFLPFTFLQMQNAAIVILLPCLCLALLWMQIPFMLLLFRVAFYKDSASFYEWEKEGIASYYKNLTGNLTAMQEMRHDIKNIFFTMGNFVDRSNDMEMKQFFWNKIYPYSVETIRQSELFSKLYQIPVETLRAFFNLKISQALSKKISVNIEVNIVPESFKTGMDIIDLTRILGILLDNAIEETVQIPNGSIVIKIAGNDAGCSYIIKNTITEQTRSRGIHTGKTTKGAERGKGLQIVQQLLEQYQNTSLNTSIQQLTYVQSLNVIFIQESIL